MEGSRTTHSPGTLTMAFDESLDALFSAPAAPKPTIDLLSIARDAASRFSCNQNSKDESNSKSFKGHTDLTATPQRNVQSDDEKNSRSVFVGNVPVSTVADKKLNKQLLKLFSAISPVESIRFRSVPVKSLTDKRAGVLSKRFDAEQKTTCNCYVVFKDAAATVKAVSQLNGSLFEQNHLRVDFVGTQSAVAQKQNAVFVGSLPSACKEEDLWQFFERCGPIESVRMLYETSTGKPKGVAYVNFVDKAAVFLALKLTTEKLLGREIRIMRYTPAGKKPKDASKKFPNYALKTRDSTKKPTLFNKDTKFPKHAKKENNPKFLKAENRIKVASDTKSSLAATNSNTMHPSANTAITSLALKRTNEKPFGAKKYNDKLAQRKSNIKTQKYPKESHGVTKKSYQKSKSANDGHKAYAASNSNGQNAKSPKKAIEVNEATNATKKGQKKSRTSINAHDDALPKKEIKSASVKDAIKTKRKLALEKPAKKNKPLKQ